MKKKIIVTLIVVASVLTIVSVALLFVHKISNQSNLPDEGESTQLSQESWLDTADNIHTVSTYSLGKSAEEINTEVKDYITIEHKYIDDIPIYEMYLKNSASNNIIFFFHGQLSRKEEYLSEMVRYVESGYYCVTVDLAGHGERICEDTLMSLQITKITGENIDTLLDYYENAVFSENINFALMGLSQGGSVVYWYSAFGKRTPSAIVVGSSTPDYTYFVDNTGIKNGSLSEEIWDEETVSSFIEENNPISQMSRFYDLPILSGNSTDDPIVSYMGSEAFEKELNNHGNKKCSFYYFNGVGHNVTEGFIQKVLPFIQKYL